MFEKKEYALSKDSAEKVLQKILDFCEIDIDEIEDKDLKSMIKKSIPRLIKAIRMGRLEVVETNGFRVKQTLRSGSDFLEYKVPAAPEKKAMGEKARDDMNGRMYAMMGSACGLGEGAIDKLDPVDLSILEVLGALFLSL